MTSSIFYQCHLDLWQSYDYSLRKLPLDIATACTKVCVIVGVDNEVTISHNLKFFSKTYLWLTFTIGQFIAKMQTSITSLQGGWGGWPTGNVNKLSNSHACCFLNCAWLLLNFFPFPVGHPPHPPCTYMNCIAILFPELMHLSVAILLSSSPAKYKRPSKTTIILSGECIAHWSECQTMTCLHSCCTKRWGPCQLLFNPTDGLSSP